MQGTAVVLPQIWGFLFIPDLAFSLLSLASFCKYLYTMAWVFSALCSSKPLKIKFDQKTCKQHYNLCAIVNQDMHTCVKEITPPAFHGRARQVDVKDNITICPEQLLSKPTDQASSSCSPSHIAIPVDQISSADMEADKAKSSAASNDMDKEQKPQEGEPKAECRFCHDEDCISRFEAPCRCSGTLKDAHKSCIQKWCNIKRKTTCEICRQPYRPGYAVIARGSSNNSEDDERLWRYSRERYRSE